MLRRAAPLRDFAWRLDVWAWGIAIASWAAMLGLLAVGGTEVLAHHAILESTSVALPMALLLFIASWQLMTGAMMLPSSLPVVAVFSRLASRQAAPRRAFGAFLAGYFVVWTAFALVALGGDAALHVLVDRWPWLAERPWLITGSVLVAAGVFQLSPLKERCLTECRNPLEFVWRRYRPGARGAWRLGVAHGIFCFGCCWALMLVMFALGVGSLVLMAALTGVMVLEKTTRFGARLVSPVAWGLIALGGVVLLTRTVAAHAGHLDADASASDGVIATALLGIGLAAAAVARRMTSRRRRG